MVSVGRWEVEIKESCLAHESPHPVMTDEKEEELWERDAEPRRGKGK